jgi:hypothetical protein
MKGPPGVMKRCFIDLHGEASARPVEVDSVSLDQLGPRLGQPMSLTKDAKPLLFGALELVVLGAVGGQDS